MKTVHAEVSQVMDVRPEVAYRVLADYHTHHPQILPKPFFASVTVEQGGQGAGTIIRVGTMGNPSAYRLTVSEPDPGHILQEEDAAVGVCTRFTVDPLDGGARSRVTIATDWRCNPGLKGWLDSKLNPLLARRIYKQELDLLAAYAKTL